MKTEYLLYALEAGENRSYMETLLTATPDKKRIEQVKKLASKDGWHSFREATFNGEAPNFAKTVNI